MFCFYYRLPYYILKLITIAIQAQKKLDSRKRKSEIGYNMNIKLDYGS